MQTVRVTTGYFPVGPGVLLRLEDGQAQSRVHALEIVNKDEGLYRVTARTGFKLGEVFGYDGPIDKARLADVVDAETGERFSVADFRAAAAEVPGEAGAALDTLSDEQLGSVVAAIMKLEPEHAADFTKAGRPDANVLSERAGFRVTAKQRDAAWTVYQAIAAAFPAEEDESDGADDADRLV